jgi:hypothetical protein
MDADALHCLSACRAFDDLLLRLTITSYTFPFIEAIEDIKKH